MFSCFALYELALNLHWNVDGLKKMYFNVPMTAPDVSQTPFGLIRMTVVVVPFLYVGTLISKNFAALLEEHDIFVPEDDDDDD